MLGYSFAAVTHSVAKDFKVVANLTVIKIKIAMKPGEIFPYDKIDDFLRQEAIKHKQTEGDPMPLREVDDT